MGWIAGMLTVDEGATVVPGEYRDDYRWNGWLVPRMKFEEAKKVLEAIAKADRHFHAIETRNNTFIVVVDLGEDEPDVDVVRPDADGWYSPGAMAWCWEDASAWGVSK